MAERIREGVYINCFANALVRSGQRVTVSVPRLGSIAAVAQGDISRQSGLQLVVTNTGVAYVFDPLRSRPGLKRQQSYTRFTPQPNPSEGSIEWITEPILNGGSTLTISSSGKKLSVSRPFFEGENPPTNPELFWGAIAKIKITGDVRIKVRFFGELFITDRQPGPITGELYVSAFLLKGTRLIFSEADAPFSSYLDYPDFVANADLLDPGFETINFTTQAIALYPDNLPIIGAQHWVAFKPTINYSMSASLTDGEYELAIEEILDYRNTKWGYFVRVEVSFS